MWYILYNIIRAANKFEKLGKKVGDITPNNILVDEDGFIRVISTISIPHELDNYQKKVQDNKS